MSRGLAVMPGTPAGLAWDGAPLEVWGLRVASAAARDDWTEALLCHLDDYQSYGISALTVFYQGSSGGSLQVFSPDGREVDAGVQQRMVRIVEAAARRRMVVVVGIFYHAQANRLDQERGAWLDGREAYVRAVELVARRLAPYENVIVNLANEHTHSFWQSCPFPMREPEGIADLCLAVKAVDPDRLVGGGGGHPGCNAELVLRPELDLLLFDSGGASAEAAAAYRASGSTKPLMNVEVFGAAAQGYVEEEDGPVAGQNVSWPGGGSTGSPAAPGRRRIQGVFPSHRQEGRHKGIANFLAEIAFAARTPGFSLFGHFPAWYQGRSRHLAFDNRFDLGGQGTRDDPGIRWYFAAVKRERSGTGEH